MPKSFTLNLKQEHIDQRDHVKPSGTGVCYCPLELALLAHFPKATGAGVGRYSWHLDLPSGGIHGTLPSDAKLFVRDFDWKESEGAELYPRKFRLLVNQA